MLQYIELTNLRCFARHRLLLRPQTVIVGRNNAGKSTVIEGFRFVGLITERYQYLNFHPVPDWLEVPRTHRGIRPALEDFDISLQNIFHRYREPPAEILARFDTGESIRTYIGPEGDSHTVLFDRGGRVVSSKAEARQLNLPRVSVLPQVAPLAKTEEILVGDYVRRNLSSALAPAHFRNQLNLLYAERFADFRRLVQDSWSGVRVLSLDGRGVIPGEELSLMIQDVDFVAEAAWMGHGLQMWLQTMWFLTRSHGHETVILDEPDVYIHPDLQRSLIRMLRGRYPQTIVATHSTEILSEIDSSDVLILERREPSSAFSTSLPAVQEVLTSIGSAQNLQLTRLWGARRLLLLEGKDMGILKRIHNTIFPHATHALEVVPNMSIGGWTGWPYAIGSSMLLKNSVGEDITVYCVLDSDYHTQSEIDHRLRDALAKRVQLYIWRKKELENYLLVPTAIQRFISGRVPMRVTPPTLDEVRDAMHCIADDLKDIVLDAVANEHWLRNRAGGLTTANREARRLVNPVWADSNARLGLVSGKDVLSALSDWSQTNFGVSFGTATIAQELQEGEIDPEVKAVLTAIERTIDFPAR